MTDTTTYNPELHGNQVWWAADRLAATLREMGCTDINTDDAYGDRDANLGAILPDGTPLSIHLNQTP